MIWSYEKMNLFLPIVQEKITRKEFETCNGLKLQQRGFLPSYNKVFTLL